MLPMVTIIEITFGFSIDGATLTETVFTWRGMGSVIVSKNKWRNTSEVTIKTPH